jgi:hypothetical protein
MTNFAYNVNIPDGPNNPSNDWSKMQVNTNNIDALINEDHYSFGVANGGLHKQVRFVNETIPTVGASQVGLYSKTAGQSQVFGTSDTGANEYQITRFVDASFASFGGYGAFGTVTPSTAGAGYTMNAGWTFLPGGLLYQYGEVISNRSPLAINPSTIVITFPVTFTTSNIVITLSPTCKAGGTSLDDTLSLVNGTRASNGFTCNFIGSTLSYVGFSWVAVGK